MSSTSAGKTITRMPSKQRSDDANLPKAGSVVNKKVLPTSNAASNGLLSEAVENPWRLFTAKELALICNVSEDTLTAVRAHEDNPFCAGKCRPEVIIRWFAGHAGWQPSKT